MDVSKEHEAKVVIFALAAFEGDFLKLVSGIDGGSDDLRFFFFGTADLEGLVDFLDHLSNKN